MITKQTAVVLLELQNDFLTEGGKLHPLLKALLDEYRVINYLNRLIEGGRARGMLIVHAPIQFSPDYREMRHAPYGIMKMVKESGALIRGTWGAEIAPAIDRQDSDTVIDGKFGMDAFFGTNLDFVLRAHGITAVALAGQLTNICIGSTMRSAYDRGYQVLGITHATASVGREQHRSSILNSRPIFSWPGTPSEFLRQAEG